MNIIIPTKLADFYKLNHIDQYPIGTRYVYSTWIPRASRMPGVNEVVSFGFRAFVLQYLEDFFNENFFNIPKNVVLDDYKDFVSNTLGVENPRADHWEALWELGYLPLEIKAIPEGTLVPLRVPAATVENTDPRFFWLTNFIETIWSNNLWLPSTSATIAHEYRKILDSYALETTGSTDGVEFQAHDFSMRGLAGLDATIMSGMGHLLSFVGTDSIPAIEGAINYYDANIYGGLVGTSIPACYDEETEILTENGFIPFGEITREIKVAQYHRDGTVSFTHPLEVFKDQFSGNMVHFQSKFADILVTPNHKMVRISAESGELSLFEAGSTEYRFRKGYSHRYHLPVAGLARGESELSPLEQLRIAFQADGSFPSRKELYTGERTGTIPIRFSLKKDRKKERLEKILANIGYQYTRADYENGYSSFWVKCDTEFTKDFSWVNLSEVSAKHAKDFIEELTYWDGSLSQKNGLRYDSTNKSCVDMVQAIGAIAGYRTSVSCHIDKRGDRKPIFSCNSIANRNLVAGGPIQKHLNPYRGMVYCVSVPSKMIIVRRNNKVSVCGNTEHSVMCAGGEDDEYETYRRLIEDIYPSGFVSIVSDTWDLWHVLTNILPELKDKIMARDGKVVIRPDSGDPVDIICGDRNASVGSPAGKGVIQLLWDIFGGSTNDKGYKVLDSHIGAIYGDSITIDRCRQICQRLKENGFASTNMVYGVGSFTYQYNTRDTFGWAMKATWVDINGEERAIYKDPITDDGTKKSLRGRVVVVEHKNGLYAVDGLTKSQQESFGDEDLLRTIFKDGITEYENFDDIRARLAKARSNGR